MNEYLKAFCYGFLLVAAYSVFEVVGVTPQRKPLPFYSGGDASLSFLAGEGGPPKPSPPSGRDFVAPQPPLNPITPTPKPSVNLGQILNPLTQPGQNPRDFVNPSIGKGGPTPVPPKVGPPVPPKPTQGGITAPQNVRPGIPPQPSGGRDFVNPNFGKTGPPVPPKPTQGGITAPQNVKPGIPPQPSGGRDFVNPNLGKVVPPAPQKPKEDFPALKPVQNSGGRDFVNPNLGPNQKPRDPFPPLGSKNAPSQPTKEPFPALRPQNRPIGGPQTDPFPVLKTPGSPSLPQPNSGPSYASKTSNGVTTSRPNVDPLGAVSEPSTVPDDGPKDEELREFSEALLKKDVNNAFKFVKLNIQEKTTSHSKDDKAPENLLEVNKDAFNIPTIQKLRLFYNNYIMDVTENEHVTPQEKQEENDFIETIMTTPIMQHTRNFLISKGKFSKDPKDFKDFLKTIWFSMYSRGKGRVGSSGFEHVFLAELKNNEVSGFHNWLYFHETEQSKLTNYLGYMKKLDLGEKGVILKFHATLSGNDKPVNAIFIGTSPELEMALYTTCYHFRANRVCPLKLNGNNFIVRTYSLKYRGKNLLGSAFAEI